MAKTEHREGTDTDGRGLGHSFATDNVVRGTAEGNVFEKRRPTYPLGDNPRGREIEWNDQNSPVQVGSIYRAYKGLVPIEGQDPLNPVRVIRVGSTKTLRPESPPRGIDSAAISAAQEAQRTQLANTDFAALYPNATITEPAPGASVSRGSRITIKVLGTHILSVFSCTLIVDGVGTDRRNLDRGAQGNASNVEFIFLYDVPANHPVGPMIIEARVFSIEVAAQGVIADDAINNFDGQFLGGVGSQDGRIGRLGSTSKTNPQLDLDPAMYLRTPEGISSITVNVI
jgi:hypothetical protein